MADGFGFHIPKGYLYAAIGFSVMIEALNQLAIFNRRRFLSANQTLRQRTADTVMRLLSGKKEDAELDAESSAMLADHSDGQIFNPQERLMIERVLNLNQRTVSSIMTSRHDIEHIDLTAPEEQIRALLDRNQHTRVVDGGDEEEELLGVVHVIDLLQQQLHGEALNLRARCASRWCSRRGYNCSLPLSNSVTRVRTLPLWWMSLVRLRGWSRSAT